MTALSDSQTDALSELINIAFGLTAAKLSEISGYRVVLDVPMVASHPMDALVNELGPFENGEVASVHQVFTGPFSGDAILFLNREGAVQLSNLLIDEDLRSDKLDATSNEILVEVGNILLSACLGVFGNLLQVHISFSIPELHLDSLRKFLTSISVGGKELQYAIVITSSFKIQERGVDGRIVIVLGVSSLEQLIQAVERWEKTQLTA